MLTNEQFEELLTLENEIPEVEFKGPGPRSNSYHLAKIARAVMGMANRRDGGTVIIGVEETNSMLNPIGLSQLDAATWRNNDRIIDALASYMTPPASFTRSIREFQGKEFVVLEIQEFAEIPIICKKNFQRDHQSGHPDVVLRDGACYIRSRHKPETVEATSSTEHMRDLLDLAIEKGVRKFVTQAQSAGMSLSEIAQSDGAELFNKQLSEDSSSPLLEKILSRGYWKAIIRPEKFSSDKIAYNALFPLVQNTAVDIFGGGFPNVVLEIPISRGTNRVGQEIEAGHFLEVWYLYQSGQFIHYADILDDWINLSDQIRMPTRWEPGKLLAIEEVIRQFTGIFVFASRLALTSAFTKDVHVIIDVLLKWLQGRYLYISTPGKVPLRPRDAQIPEFRYTKSFPKDELIARPKELALQASREVFLRFGWDPAQALLENIQATFNLT